MRRKVVFVQGAPLPDGYLDGIRASCAELHIVTCSDNREAIESVIGGSAGLINCPRPLFDAKLLDIAGDLLQWIHVGGAGCEEFLINEVVESDITLTNGKIIQGPEVSDHAMALLLCLTRNLHLVLRGNIPVRDMPRPIELRGKTATVIGGGGIGLLIAEKASAFGMTVRVIADEYRPLLSFVSEYLPPSRLLEGLAQSDAVFMAAPHTKLTERMMNEKAFGALKPSTYYVAVSRGACTDTEALTTALRRGTIAGAGLDVTYPEPLPEEHPLRNMDSVILSPHIAGPSDKNRRRTFALIKANLMRFNDGSTLYNTVDKRNGW